MKNNISQFTSYNCNTSPAIFLIISLLRALHRKKRNGETATSIQLYSMTKAITRLHTYVHTSVVRARSYNWTERERKTSIYAFTRLCLLMDVFEIVPVPIKLTPCLSASVCTLYARIQATVLILNQQIGCCHWCSLLEFCRQMTSSGAVDNFSEDAMFGIRVMCEYDDWIDALRETVKGMLVQLGFFLLIFTQFWSKCYYINLISIKSRIITQPQHQLTVRSVFHFFLLIQCLPTRAKSLICIGNFFSATWDSSLDPMVAIPIFGTCFNNW